MPSNELVKVDRLQTSDIMSTAKAFFESGMFQDIKSAAQAVVKIQAGQELGIPPFASMSGIHIIQGKPTVGAGLIAARVKGSGKYDYRVIEQTEKNCSIDFYQGKEKLGNSSFSLDDAKKAQTKNIDRFPRNMLFARAISNGVKWYCPDIFAGPVYVPEEMAQVTEDAPAGAVTIVVHDEVKIEPMLPAITNAQYTKIMNRLRAGEIEVYEKALSTYSFEETQRRLFDEEYQKQYSVVKEGL